MGSVSVQSECGGFVSGGGMNLAKNVIFSL